MKYICFILSLFLSKTDVVAQPTNFSISTNLEGQYNLRDGQHFGAFGHAVKAHFHFSPRDGIYISGSYYSNGKFSNNIIAQARSSTTTPQQIAVRNNSLMRLKQLSIGWQRYLKGSFQAEGGWNLYGFAGFGIMPGKIENTFSRSIDTTAYSLPVKPGEGKFKRLTFDIGTGIEVPIGGDFFLYSEGKLWIPASDYPTKFLLVNENAPLLIMLGVGVRILF